jgi:hypothetical protein
MFTSLILIFFWVTAALSQTNTATSNHHLLRSFNPRTHPCYQTLRDPDSITIERVKAIWDAPLHSSERIKLKTLSSTELPKILAEPLVTPLMDPLTYEGEPLMCMFNPDVNIVFKKGSDRLEVVLCLSCNQLKLYFNEAKIHWGPFYRYRKTLDWLLPMLFPDDAYLMERTRSNGAKLHIQFQRVFFQNGGFRAEFFVENGTQETYWFIGGSPQSPEIDTQKNESGRWVEELLFYCDLGKEAHPLPAGRTLRFTSHLVTNDGIPLPMKAGITFSKTRSFEEKLQIWSDPVSITKTGLARVYELFDPVY